MWLFCTSLLGVKRLHDLSNIYIGVRVGNRKTIFFASEILKIAFMFRLKRFIPLKIYGYIVLRVWKKSHYSPIEFFY